jgi:hypothetical protein
MPHSTTTPRRFMVVTLSLCLALLATNSDSATRKKKAKHPTPAAVVNDNPGVPGSLVRRSPWAALADLPNLTEGVWGNTSLGPAGAVGMLPPLKVELNYATINRVGIEPPVHDESCLPEGMPSVMLRPHPFEFVFEPGRITLLLELNNQVRRIYTDGRAHPTDGALSYGGHSIGHWEKTTLVVDTVGIVPEAQIAPGIPANGPVHITERMHLSNADALTIDTTIEAPAVLTRPWSYSMSYQRHRDQGVQEYLCRQEPAVH